MAQKKNEPKKDEGETKTVTEAPKETKPAAQAAPVAQTTTQQQTAPAPTPAQTTTNNQQPAPANSGQKSNALPWILGCCCGGCLFVILIIVLFWVLSFAGVIPPVIGGFFGI